MGRLLTSSLVLTVETIEALLAAVLGSREKTLYEVDVQCTVPGNSQVDIMALADQVSEAMAASAESVQCGGSQKERTLRLWVELEAPTPATAVQRVTDALDAVNTRLAKEGGIGAVGIKLTELETSNPEPTKLHTLTNSLS